jgi:hypothetical protein
VRDAVNTNLLKVKSVTVYCPTPEPATPTPPPTSPPTNPPTNTPEPTLPPTPEPTPTPTPIPCYEYIIDNDYSEAQNEVYTYVACDGTASSPNTIFAGFQITNLCAQMGSVVVSNIQSRVYEGSSCS